MEEQSLNELLKTAIYTVDSKITYTSFSRDDLLECKKDITIEEVSLDDFKRTKKIHDKILKTDCVIFIDDNCIKVLETRLKLIKEYVMKN